MRKSFLSDAHPSRQLVFTALIVIASWLIFQLAGMVSGVFLFDLTFNDLLNLMAFTDDPKIVDFLKYIQAFTSTGMFIFAALASAWFIDPDWKGFLGLDKNPGLTASILSVVFILVILPFINLLTYLNANMNLPDFMGGLEEFFRNKEEQMNDLMESFLKPGGKGGLFVNILVIAVIPAIGEELIFRGVVQKLFARWFNNSLWAIFITAFLFSAMHIQFLSFMPRFFLGLVLGYLFFRSGSIWLVIIVHFFNNAMATVYYYYYFGGFTGDYVEKVGTPGNSIFMALIGLVLGSGLLFLILRNKENRKDIN